MWRKLGLMTLLSMSGYLYAADIALTMRAEKRSTVIVNGETLSIHKAITRINVGDQITIVLNYHNKSQDDAYNVHIDNPIPAGTRFILGSGFGKEAVFLVSYDGGITYEEDFKIHNTPVTHVRWQFENLAGNAQGEVGFQLQVERADHKLLR
ncbi:MAG: hypothetical protein I8H92_06240 [Moraxellaceae bacterium]|nr:hypothetical protein [Moraxellaceae bacterium]